MTEMTPTQVKQFNALVEMAQALDGQMAYLEKALRELRERVAKLEGRGDD